MPLTPAHEADRVLTPQEVDEILAKASFEEIMAEGSFEKAELLDALYAVGARVKMGSAEEPIAFEYTDPSGRTTKYRIPGAGEEPKPFSARVAVYVFANQDYPVFGGRSYVGGVIDEKDNLTPVRPIPGRPNLISFALEKDA